MDRYIAIFIAFCLALAGVAAGAISYVITHPKDDLDYFETDPGGTFLSSFSSHNELLNYMNKFLDKYNNGYYLPFGGATWDMTLSGERSDSIPSYSETNVQVQGIDEEDIVKTDGEYIYLASHGEVSIFKAYPPEEMILITNITAKELYSGELNISNMGIRGLYISSEKLIVISIIIVLDEEELTNEKEMYDLWYYWPRGTTYTLISIFDIGDVDNPELLSSFGISGYFFTSRMTDNCVYAISSQYFGYYTEDEEKYLPTLLIDDTIEPFQANKILYDPEMENSHRFQNIIAIDFEEMSTNYLAIIMGYGSEMYMSHNAIYLTFEKTDTNVFQERFWITSTQNYLFTKIYKVKIYGILMGVTAEGVVKGGLLNQFSMDEHDSYFRVATTTSWNDLKNNVYVMDDDLNIVGSLEDLAPTERIYSARFLGDTLYLVTFRQVDPFFVIDLSNPEKPKVLGELKIPGFSSYLHPMDENYVLGIGRMDTLVKISLFDVSDPMNPKETTNLTIGDGYSYSPALYDHKAVLFDLEKELLSIPISIYGGWYLNGSYYYTQGACVLNVSIEDGIEMRGIIDHNGSYVSRSLYIGDYLYTVSTSMIMVNSLIDLSYVNSIEYESTYGYYWIL